MVHPRRCRSIPPSPFLISPILLLLPFFFLFFFLFLRPLSGIRRSEPASPTPSPHSVISHQWDTGICRLSLTWLPTLCLHLSPRCLSFSFSRYSAILWCISRRDMQRCRELREYKSMEYIERWRWRESMEHCNRQLRGLRVLCLLT